MNIPVVGILDMAGCLDEFNLHSFQLVDLVIDRDGCILALLADKIPRRIDGMYVPTVSDARYQALRITVDWLCGERIAAEPVDFGQIEINAHFIQKLRDGYLLLGARARLHEDGRADQNALITDGQGRPLARHCFGDGINQCLVDKQNRIITSYCDEGVFGNYGWSEPVGSRGLIVWADDGSRLWENEKYRIYDCYAMNLDGQDRLWFYYYSDFQLVRTDYHQDLVFDPQMGGGGRFLLKGSGEAVLFVGGHDSFSQFVVKPLGSFPPGRGEGACFVFDGRLLKPVEVSFRGSKAILRDGQRNFYMTDWL